MAASHGESFPTGDIHGSGFRAIQEYFQQRSCRFCFQPFAADGIELLRQEPGVLVVRVACSMCTKPLGIALVGMNTEKCNEVAETPNGKLTERYPLDWSKKDIERLASLSPISYDDVLDAHLFFESLDESWVSLLPPTKAKI